MKIHHGTPGFQSSFGAGLQHYCSHSKINIAVLDRCRTILAMSGWMVGLESQGGVRYLAPDDAKKETSWGVQGFQDLYMCRLKYLRLRNRTFL